MGNNALNANGFTNTVSTNNHITVRGSDWYWTVCAVMTVTTFIIAGLSFTKPRSQRLFHYITASITLVAAIAYFSMGANLGWTAIQVEFDRSNPKVAGNMRQIFYVRYIDWFITTPLLLTDLLLTCGMPVPTIAYVILMNEVMIVTGLVGSLVKSSYKWGKALFPLSVIIKANQLTRIFHLWLCRIFVCSILRDHRRSRICSCSRKGHSQSLHHVWCLDHFLVVFVSHCLGSQ
jgi:bacteriorhodopsin